VSIVRKIIFYLLLFVVFVGDAQDLPPIQVFTTQDYSAEDQNWAISQSRNGFIYVANNKGLLEYNGATWALYPSPNEDIFRSVRVVNNYIYTGGYRDFGYWTKNEFGNLFYTSLSNNRDFEINEDEEIWGILDIEGYILFQSLERIYIYDISQDSFKIIDSQTRINKMFSANGSIYFQKNNEGVFKIENGVDVLLVDSERILNGEVVNIYEINNGLLFQTKELGFLKFENNEIIKWDITANETLSQLTIYSSVRLNDGSFILGSISNGILHLDADGNILSTINQAYGLSNNTVLSIKEDSNGNVWLGLDNGINVLNYNSPYKVYKDKQGVLGTVYASAKTNGFLYLGTNQGLFYKKIEDDSGFNFIDGTEGQVWSLELLHGALFCGHDEGTFVINNNKASKISDELGTWTIKEISNRPDLLIQGNYKGLNILEKVDNIWCYRNKLDGFDISSRYLEFSDVNEVLVSHEYKGVYKINIDDGYKNVKSYKKVSVKEGIKSSILSYNNSILYSYKEGCFYYDSENNTFKKDTLLSSLFSNNSYVSGKLINDFESKKLWGFTKNEIIYVQPGKLSNEPEVNVISIPSEIRKNKLGFENILHISEDNYLIGTTEGYLVIDLNKLDKTPQAIYLNNISYNSRNNKFIPIDLNQTISLSNNKSSIQFKYSVPNYNKLSASVYQYRLLGIYDDWSKWLSTSEVYFENLPHGDYKFEAKAMTGGVASINVLSYNFTIEKPWYLKPLAISVYILSSLVFIFLLHYFNNRFYKKQKQKLIDKKERELELEQLESQRQLILFKNKNLTLDIDNKNRELGMATMNLVKRNELLNNIKEELSKSKSLIEIKSVVKLIDSSINNTSDWKLFEEAFNNVDKDFMKRVKTLHPTITPNDLRLCAYLRLNLSSKEIAPLLNISHKSVEVKRYRLRKKMELDHDQSLSNYIIEL
tara:strand:+ start:606 stop:3410 length:2805 start_codon:yes stop_codon:yes gene_type:complete